MRANRFSWGNFIIRFIMALVLVFASYNPTGYSYYDWAIRLLPEVSPVKAFAGIVLLIGWIIFIRATLRSLGFIGILLAVAIFGTLFWMIIDWGFVSAGNIEAVTYISQVILCFILATGMSWSHIRRRMSGQVDADDVDN
ncbi:MAG: hypothetical protein COB62_02690 [Piscirickettsiaceae bacterium]|nr:MAG: hypothetical protein COB62_02690 [Piscirickettsiaceae bacterium]